MKIRKILAWVLLSLMFVMCFNGMASAEESLEDKIYDDILWLYHPNINAGVYIVDLGYSVEEWYEAAEKALERAYANGTWNRDVYEEDIPLDPSESIALFQELQKSDLGDSSVPMVGLCAVAVFALGGMMIARNKRRAMN